MGRAGHPRARRSSSQVLAMAHLRRGRTQLQTVGCGRRCPQDCLPGHRPSCTSAAPPRSRFPSEGPSHRHPGPQTQSPLRGQGTQGASPTAYSLPSEEHLTVCKVFSHSLALPSTGYRAPGSIQGLAFNTSFCPANRSKFHFTGEAAEAQRG